MTVTRNLPDALSLVGKRVLVSGAASGIGRPTGLALAALGGPQGLWPT